MENFNLSVLTNYRKIIYNKKIKNQKMSTVSVLIRTINEQCFKDLNLNKCKSVETVLLMTNAIIISV